MNHRPRILTLSGVRGDTRRYRSFHTYEQLRLAGVDSELSHITDPALPEKIGAADIIFFHRVAFDPYVEGLLESIKKRNSLAVLDTDDLIFYPPAFQWIDSPDFQATVRASLYQEDMRRNDETLQACHAVTASTNYLAEFTRNSGKPSWVHRNAFSLEMLDISERAYQGKEPASDRIVIGYASGTPTHDSDFDVVKPALKRILERCPHTELWLIGPLNPGKDWGAVEGRIKTLKWVPWRQLPSILVQFDINLAPLVKDNPFAQSKSEIKFVEAALVRVPTIASPTKAFSFAIQTEQNGILADSEQDWEDALSQLIEDQDKRDTIRDQAYKGVTSKYHPAQRAVQLINTINDIHSDVHGDVLWQGDEIDVLSQDLLSTDSDLTNYWSCAVSEEKPTLSDMAKYTARHRGIRTLLKQFWIYFRRSLAPVFPYKTSNV